MQLPRQVHTLFHHPQGMERIRKHPFLSHQQAGEGSCFGLVLLVRGTASEPGSGCCCSSFQPGLSHRS